VRDDPRAVTHFGLIAEEEAVVYPDPIVASAGTPA